MTVGAVLDFSVNYSKRPLAARPKPVEGCERSYGSTSSPRAVRPASFKWSFRIFCL